MRALIAFGIVFCLGSSAQAAPSPEAMLLKAMQLAPSGKVRVLASGTAIKAYIKAKLVRRAPDDQRDYTDSRRLRKPAKLLGHDLLIVEEEYRWKQYVGCCVSPGVGAVIRQTGSMSELEDFVRTNKCGLTALPNQADGLTDYGVQMISGESYWQISCRERDWQKE